MESEYISNKIKSIQAQLNLIKYLVVAGNKKSKMVHLEGALGDIFVSEEDIEEAKKSLFN